MGEITDVISNGSNTTWWVRSAVSNQVSVDDSLCHDGVCLTIEEIRDGGHRVTAIAETLEKTTLREWKTGSRVNLERPMQMNGRIDGHLVQGHVDSTATCTDRNDRDGSTEFTFRYKRKFAPLLIEKGSICVNGVSLTAFRAGAKKFTVAIIPFTMEHTNLSGLGPGSRVNLEFDMIGKYVNRIKALKK